MTGKETSRYEMLVRIRDFGAAYGERFPKSTVGGDAFATVEDAVSQLEQHGASRYSKRHIVRGSAATNTTAYRDLIAMLDTISLTARAVGLDTPDAAKQFHVPKRRGTAAMLNAARSFVDDATPLAKSFVAHGMPKDFVSQLQTKIGAFEQARKERETGKEQSAAARAEMAKAFELGMDAVQRLDAIVHNVLGDDASAVTAWEVARRTEQPRTLRKKRGAAPDVVVAEPQIPTAATPPAPVVTPAPAPTTAPVVLNPQPTDATVA